MTITEIVSNLIDKGILERDKQKSLEHKTRKVKLDLNGFKTVSPSSASLITIDDMGFRDLIGKCSRELWFNTLGIDPSNPPGAQSLRKMSLGKNVEDEEQQSILLGIDQLAKTTNIKAFTNILIVHKNTTFKEKKIAVLGEIDLLLIINGIPVPVEIKSIYGYNAVKEIFGNTKTIGRPKKQHFLQIACYVYMLSRLDEIELYHTNGQLATDIIELIKSPCHEGVIRYIDRSNCATTNFSIGLGKTTDLNNKVPLVNGEEFMPITMYDIYNRFIIVSDLLNRSFGFTEEKIHYNFIPPRDSTFQYSQKRLDYYYNLKDTTYMSKTKKLLYSKSGTIHMGDYQCSYCNYKAICLGFDPYSTPLPTDEEIINKVKRIYAGEENVTVVEKSDEEEETS